MKKQMLLFWVLTFILSITGCKMPLKTEETQTSPAGLISEERIFTPTGEVMEVSLDGNRVAGTFKSQNAEEYGVYLLDVDEAGYVRIAYRWLTDPALRTVFEVYHSEYVSADYRVYAFDNGILLLELYYDEMQGLSFRLTKIGGGSYDAPYAVYEDTCERMPYITVVDLFESSALAATTPRILLNYDSGGLSRLLLLSHYGTMGEHIMISSGMYGRYEEGALENGRRIVFAGGYGNSIYYQALYNWIGDPHPEIVTFESTGTAVLFRYDCFTEEILRVTDLEKIALHINASENYALVSEYDYHEPLIDSGKLLSLKDERENYSIPEVESGADICASRFIAEDKVVFYTPRMLYFADLDNGVLYTCALKDNALILLDDDNVNIIDNGDEQAKVQCIAYSEAFGD